MANANDEIPPPYDDIKFQSVGSYGGSFYQPLTKFSEKLGNIVSKELEPRLLKQLCFMHKIDYIIPSASKLMDAKRFLKELNQRKQICITYLIANMIMCKNMAIADMLRVEVLEKCTQDFQDLDKLYNKALQVKLEKGVVGIQFKFLQARFCVVKTFSCMTEAHHNTLKMVLVEEGLLVKNDVARLPHYIDTLLYIDSRCTGLSFDKLIEVLSKEGKELNRYATDLEKYMAEHNILRN